MNFLIDDSQNKLILQVFNDIEKSLDYSVKKGTKSQDELFNQIFGPDIQKQPVYVKNTKSKSINDCNEYGQVQEYERIGHPSTEIKQQATQKPVNPDLLKNSKTLSNIHLRHLVNSYLKSQCKKIQSMQNNYSCDKVKESARNLLLNFFLRYTLIFEQLQTMTSSETIEKQLRKSLSTIYVEIFSTIYKKGFRSYLTILKMIIRIWNICSYVQNDTFFHIKREVRHILGIDIEFLLPQNDKLTYELAFNLRRMPVPVDFSYEKEKQRKKQEKNQRKQQKLKKKVILQIKQQKNSKGSLKNIKLETQIPSNTLKNQQKATLNSSIKQKAITKIEHQQLKEILTQKIENKLQYKHDQGLKKQKKPTIKTQSSQNKNNTINLQDQEEQKNHNNDLFSKANQKINPNNFSAQQTPKSNQNIMKSEINSNDKRFIDSLRKKIKSENSLKKQIFYQSKQS